MVSVYLSARDLLSAVLIVFAQAGMTFRGYSTFYVLSILQLLMFALPRVHSCNPKQWMPFFALNATLFQPF